MPDLPVVVAHGALGVTVGLALPKSVALIDDILTLGETEFDFNLSAYEINLERNDRKPLFANLAIETDQFLAV